MFGQLLRGGLSTLKWALCGIGLLSLVVLALLATPLQPLPELQSISRVRGTVDLSSLPAVERFQGRDGTWLGFRHYAAGGAPTDRVAIVIHGSSGSSGGTIHALSQALAARGVETYAVDIRGAAFIENDGKRVDRCVRFREGRAALDRPFEKDLGFLRLLGCGVEILE